MGSFRVISQVGSISAGGLPSGAGIAPGDVLAITVTGFMEPVSGLVTLSVGITPPATLGTFSGVHLWLEVPDQSAAPAAVVGATTVGGTAAVTGPWSPFDIGFQPYVASQQPWAISFPGPVGLDSTVDTPARLYAVSISNVTENHLIQANQPSPSPNQTFTLVSLASGTPTAGTNVTGIIGGDGAGITIVATVLPPQNVTGKLETPVLVLVSDTPPATSGWVAQLVLSIGEDAGLGENVANQQIIPGIITQAGPVAGPPADGITLAHSFVLDTPATFVKANLWLQAGLVDADGKYQWNNIVAAVTPHFPITYGSTTGTHDAASIMLSSLQSSMAVSGALFGVAPAGIDTSLLGPFSVSTLNIQNIAVTNPQLSALAVQAAQLSSGSVTPTAIAALAVGTAAIQTLAVTNGLIANAAIGSAQIQSGQILTANIGVGQVATATIGTAAVSTANIGTGQIVTSHIGFAQIDDSKIITMTLTKLTGGSATFSSTATFTGPGGNTLVMSGSNLTLTGAASGSTLVMNSTSLTLTGAASGSTLVMNSSTITLTGAGSGSRLVLSATTINLTVDGVHGITIDSSGAATFTNTSGVTTVIDPLGVTTPTLGAASIGVSGTGVFGNLEISPGVLIYFHLLGGNVTSSATSGSASALPGPPAGYYKMTINGVDSRVPYYNA